MKHSSKLIMVIAALALGSGSAAMAGTTNYKGKGHAVTTYVILPLGNGGAAVQLSNSSMATIEPSESGFMMGECAGLGYLGPEGGAIGGSAFCTFEENAKDSFDVRANFETQGAKGGGKVEVIGGSGKWEGATGTGTFKRTFLDGNRTSFEYEFKITTP